MTSPTMKRPGGALAKKPLHVLFLLDVSGSMRADGKIQALNNAMREAIPAIREAAEQNVGAQVLVRVITFGTGVRWHIAEPTPVHELTWTDVDGDGETSMGAALKAAAEALRMPPMEMRSLPPVLVLVSDGRPTDGFTAGLEALMGEFWGERAVRVAIAIGRDADRRYLERFIANPERRVLEAYNPEALARQFQFASTLAIGQSSGLVGGSEPAPAPPTDTREWVW
jgi:uncharacterized protein YegL